MKTIKVELTFHTGRKTKTAFKGTLKQAEKQFMNQWYNIGINEIDYQQVKDVKGVD